VADGFRRHFGQSEPISHYLKAASRYCGASFDRIEPLTVVKPMLDYSLARRAGTLGDDGSIMAKPN
jgi:hypothetical protein